MEKEEVIANLKKGGGGGVGAALKVLPQVLDVGIHDSLYVKIYIENQS